ncbi:MAG: radical SAM/SPASM domain-containing protein [Spirochaetes bacterium]|nr:MAG: radical SAM/SPASM domain-containing protein [Spirochaetota bacterium]
MRERNASEKHIPRLIAWEVTKRCSLNCKHCRAVAEDREFKGEFSTEECFRVLENVAGFARPIMILTGGEPMAREDIFDIAGFGTKLGLKMVMAPCGLLMNRDNTRRMKECGIKRISLSIDGADRETHDSFRGVDGAFDAVVRAARIAREAGLEFQINTTVTRHNYLQLDRILELSIELGAVSYHPFLLVPTGRGKELKDCEIEPEEYERVLSWIYERSRSLPIQMKPTCAPHYYRIFRQKEREAGRKVTVETHGMDAMSKGCLGGQGFAFISNTGRVQICGFLDVEAGDIRRENYDFRKIWETSKLFEEMRDLDRYHGRCGVCEYRMFCGGCRARAYATTGHYLDEEPYCVYQPKRKIKEPVSYES